MSERDYVRSFFDNPKQLELATGGLNCLAASLNVVTGAIYRSEGNNTVASLYVLIALLSSISGILIVAHSNSIPQESK